MITPYWHDDDAGLALYLGDCREILPELGLQADLIVADPPFGETSLDWDCWPIGWLKAAAAHASSLWCFGSQRMFFDHLAEFRADWTLSQDVVGHDEDGRPVTSDVHVVWEKHNGTGFAKDRFKRVHEHALHWYRGPWGAQHQDTPRETYTGPDKHARARYDDRAAHAGAIKAVTYRDDGTRLMRSVIKVKSVRGGINETEKPLPLLEPLIHYACPPGGLVVDPMAGSCSVLEVARLMGRPAIGIEKRESQCEAAALRLSAMTLPIT
jgi:site-specific DNA-methyltransferase (adenine-specific)